MENVERMSLGKYIRSCFDKLFGGCVGLANDTHDLDLLFSVVTKLMSEQ